MSRFGWIGVAALMGCAGCATGATVEQLRSRAEFDLPCNKSQIQIAEVDERTQQVTGCGKQATYTRSCSMSASGIKECVWVQKK